jgi:hypothetical protein
VADQKPPVKPHLVLKALPGRLAVCRLAAEAPFPAWAVGAVTSVTRTPDELSVVCAEEAVPADVRAERGFGCLAVVGRLDFALTGVIASLAAPMAEAGVSVFVVSTFETDLVLVREQSLPQAAKALRAAGHRLTGLP